MFSYRNITMLIKNYRSIYLNSDFVF